MAARDLPRELLRELLRELRPKVVLDGRYEPLQTGIGAEKPSRHYGLRSCRVEKWEYPSLRA